MNKPRLYMALSLALLAAAAAGCGRRPRPAVVVARIPVETVTADQGLIEERVIATGTIEPMRRASPATKITGRVIEVNFVEGQHVKADTVLVRILDTDIRAQRAQSEAAMNASRASLEGLKSRHVELQAVLTNAQAEWERARKLLEGKAISKSEYDAATRELEVGKARVAGLAAQKDEIEANIALQAARMQEADVMLKYAVVTAPFEGFVQRKMVEVGDLAAPGAPVLVLDDLSKVKVAADVSESDIPKVRIGGDAVLKIDALPGVEPAGKVSRVVWSGDPQSRAFRVEVVLDNVFDESGAPRYLPAMFVTVEIVTARREKALRIPHAAVIERGDERFVYRVEGERALWTKVQLGLRDLRYFEVLGGLSAGDKLVTVGKENLTDQQTVRVMTPGQTEP